MVQEELFAIPAAVGMAPDKSNNGQVLAAIKQLISTALSDGGVLQLVNDATTGIASLGFNTQQKIVAATDTAGTVYFLPQTYTDSQTDYIQQLGYVPGGGNAAGYLSVVTAKGTYQGAMQPWVTANFVAGLANDVTVAMQSMGFNTQQDIVACTDTAGNVRFLPQTYTDSQTAYIQRLGYVSKDSSGLSYLSIETAEGNYLGATRDWTAASYVAQLSNAYTTPVVSIGFNTQQNIVACTDSAGVVRFLPQTYTDSQTAYIERLGYVAKDSSGLSYLSIETAEGNYLGATRDWTAASYVAQLSNAYTTPVVSIGFNTQQNIVACTDSAGVVRFLPQTYTDSQTAYIERLGYVAKDSSGLSYLSIETAEGNYLGATRDWAAATYVAQLSNANTTPVVSIGFNTDQNIVACTDSKGVARFLPQTYTDSQTAYIQRLGYVADDGSGADYLSIETASGNYLGATRSWTTAQVDAVSPGRLLNVQKFATPGSATYTPTAGTKTIEVLVQGGGAAGGSCAATASNEIAMGAAGGAGAFAFARYAISSLDVSSGVPITVGGYGTASAGNAGGNGGASSFGSYCTAPGGIGGFYGTANVSASNIFSGSSGRSATPSGSGILVSEIGESGGPCIATGVVTGNAIGVMAGGRSRFGSGGPPMSGGSGSPGSAQNFGAGGSGACCGPNNTTGVVAGNGGGGLILIREYA
ncbi:glycine-rich domain-containing protein [Komagataeibacter medellinensis]|nr:hypothetical protein [Komagataeibacter medellinensis]